MKNVVKQYAAPEDISQSNLRSRVIELAKKHSIAMNYPEGMTPEKALGAFMDLTGVPVAFIAEGLRITLDKIQKGSDTLFVGANLPAAATGVLLFKGVKKIGLAEKRQKELVNLKANLQQDIDNLKALYAVLDQNESLSSLKDSHGNEIKGRDGVRDFIETKHPSSKLLKAMSKFETKMKRAEDLNSKQSKVQNSLWIDLTKSISEEITRLEKLQHTDTKGMSPIKKLITELHNWFKDIMLSFRESKLQGLKHLAFGLGEVLLGICAVVTTIAVFLSTTLPLMVASFGVNLATRAANLMAGLCVAAFATVYKICAVINANVALFVNDEKAAEFQQKAAERKSEMLMLARKFFDKALENPIEKIKEVAAGLTNRSHSGQRFVSKVDMQQPENLQDPTERGRSQSIEVVRPVVNTATRGSSVGGGDQILDAGVLPKRVGPQSGEGIEGAFVVIARDVTEGASVLMNGPDQQSVIAAGVVPIAKGGGV